jgi:uncharacterized protein YlxP (DUF503 family)
LPAPNRTNKGFVGILAVELHFLEARSLKEKRMHLRRIRDQVTRRYGASFAEVGFQDVWQRTRIIMAVAASDVHVLENELGRLKMYLDAQEWVMSSCATEVVDVDA